MKRRITNPRCVVRRLFVLLLCSGSPAASLSFAQHCPYGRVDVAALTAQMEQTKDSNVILRSTAIAGTALLPVLRRLSKPGMSLETVPGAAQVSLAKLGDENAMAELIDELNGGRSFSPPSSAIQKLLLVGNSKAITILLNYLAAHPTPVWEGWQVDNPYDIRRGIIIGLADILEEAPIRKNGKYQGTLEDWVSWWKHGKLKPNPLSVSDDFQQPYLQCLCRKIEWGFPMAIIDLGATGDSRAVPIIQKLGSMGYPFEGYAGTRAPYIWLRHDYVETALAAWGDAEAFATVEHELQTNAFQTAILKLQVIGGKKAMAALMDANVNPGYGMFNHALFESLSEMVQNPPLPENADPTADNRHTWGEWWVKNKDTVEFVRPSPYE
jgi:HEAT repeat protein